MTESSRTQVGTTDDRSAFVTGQPTGAAGVAAAERPLSPGTNWFDRSGADTRKMHKQIDGSGARTIEGVNQATGVLPPCRWTGTTSP